MIRILDLKAGKEITEKLQLRWLIHSYRMKNEIRTTQCHCFGRSEIEISVLCCCQFEKHARPCTFVRPVRMLFLWFTSVVCCVTGRDMKITV
jgi:hypothetical protein